MTQHVQSGTGLYSGGHGAGVEGVTDAERGLQVAVRDAGLGALGDKVKNSGSSSFRTGAGGGGDGNQGVEFAVDGSAFAQRCVDEVEEVGFRVAVVQIHQLGCVDYGTTANGEEEIWIVRLGPSYGFFDAEGGLGRGHRGMM
jgi:hypothetical protein